VDVLRSLQQPIDDLAALELRFAIVSQEGPYFLGTWRNAEQVDVNAAQEVGVGAKFRRQHLDALKLLVDQLIELLVRRRIRPLVRGMRNKHRHWVDGKLAFVADYHRRLALALGLDQSLRTDRRDGIGAAAVNCFAGNIPAGTVGEISDDRQLL